MTRTPRRSITPLSRLTTLGAGLLLACSLTACGGGDDEDGGPDPSSSESGDAGEDESGDGDAASAGVEGFCTDYTSIIDELQSVDQEASQEEQATAGVKALKAWGETLSDAEVPEEMPDDAQEGLDVIVSTIADLDEDADLADLADLSPEFSDEEAASSQAFTDWATQECPLDLGNLAPQ